MPREILGDVVNPSVKVGTRKWHTVPLSIGGHALILGALVAAPLASADVLPLPGSVVIFSAPLPPSPPPTPQPPARAPHAARPVDIIDDAAPLVAPTTASPEPAPQAVQGLAGAIALSERLTFDDAPSAAIARPPEAPAVVTPVRVGGGIQPPRLLSRADPAYPTFARNARLQGFVVVEATIARDGAVKDVRLLRSAHALLDKAALDAVARWKYSPTTLNGDAVEVLLSVTVTFTLK